MAIRMGLLCVIFKIYYIKTKHNSKREGVSSFVCTHSSSYTSKALCQNLQLWRKVWLKLPSWDRELGQWQVVFTSPAAARMCVMKEEQSGHKMHRSQKSKNKLLLHCCHKAAHMHAPVQNTQEGHVFYLKFRHPICRPSESRIRSLALHSEWTSLISQTTSAGCCLQDRWETVS